MVGKLMVMLFEPTRGHIPFTTLLFPPILWWDELGRKGDNLRPSRFDDDGCTRAVPLLALQ